jgi:hypothetical protein
MIGGQNLPKFNKDNTLMNSYLLDTEHAVQNLISLANEERKKLEHKQGELSKARAISKLHKWDFETSDLNDDFSEAYSLAAFTRMAESYAQAEKLDQEIMTLEAVIIAQQISIQALNGAILQIAKQGISLVHNDLNQAPTGRSIGSTTLRDVIVAARNQSLHYEEPITNKNTVAVFSILEKEQGHIFSLANHPKQSRATQVIDLLDWYEYESYIQDMQQLLP